MQLIKWSLGKALLAVLVCNVVLHAQSAEAGNPFNKYLDPQAGVNLLSGTVAFEHAIAALNPGGKVGAGIALNYSSNVSRAAIVRNDLMPTSWVGLGWSLGYARVSCDHKGTKSIVDDDCVFIQATGVSQKIRRISEGNITKYILEQDPYWKISIRTVFTQPNRIAGWTLVDPNGVIYEFGNPDSDLSYQATQNILAWEIPEDKAYVGEGLEGNHTTYPVQWNLRRISDAYSNWIEFKYQQFVEPLQYKDWVSTPYTKESYLKSMTTSDDIEVVFTLGEKGEGQYRGEYLDPKVQGEDAPLAEGNSNLDFSGRNYDSNYDFYESKYLDKIEIFRKRGQENLLLQAFDFCYRAANPYGRRNGYVKRLLEKIVEKDANSNVVGEDVFEYHLREPGTLSSAPFGFLKKMVGKNCGSVEFTYDVETMASHVKNQEINLGFSPGGNDELVQGRLDDGTEYFIVHNNSKFHVFGWISGKWQKMPVGNETNTDGLPKVAYGSKRYFVPGGGGWFVEVASTFSEPPDREPTKSARVWEWNGRYWNITAEPTLRVKWTSFPGTISIVPGKDFFVVYNHLYEHNSGTGYSVYAYSKGSNWQGGEIFSGPANNLGCNRDPVVYVGGSHVLVYYLRAGATTCINAHGLKVYTKYERSHWRETLSLTGFSSTNSFLINEKFLAIMDGYYTFDYKIYNWGGRNWVQTKGWTPLSGFEPIGNSNSIMGGGNDYLVVRHDDADQMTVVDWNGSVWQKAISRNLVNFDLDIFVDAKWRYRQGNEYFVALSPEYDKVYTDRCILRSWRGRCLIRLPKFLVWATQYPDAAYSVFQRDQMGQWKTIMYMNTMQSPKTKDKEAITGMNWWGSYKNQDTHKIHVFNGESWLEESSNAAKEMIDGAKSLGGMFFYKYHQQKLYIYRKVNDSFTSSFELPVVRRKTVFDPVTNKISSWGYAYGRNSNIQATFDGPNNTAMFPNAEIQLPDNNGSIVMEYCQPQNMSELDKRGLVCTQKMLDQARKVVQTNETVYSPLRGENWPEGVVRWSPTQQITTHKGVRSVVDMEYAMNVNGQIRLQKKSGAGRPWTTKTKYAVEVPEFAPHFTASNMLTDVAEVIEYAHSVDTDNSKIRSGNAFWYGVTISNTPPHLQRRYSWEPQNHKNGMPAGSFSFSNPSTSADWKIMESYLVDPVIGKVKETTDRAERKHSTLYASENQLPIAVIEDASLAEVAIFTGQRLQTDWVIGNAQIVTLAGYGIDLSINQPRGRFAPNAVQVNGNGPTTYVEAAGSTPYRVSVWVLPTPGAKLHLEFFGLSRSFTELVAGSWQLVEWVVPEGQVSAGPSIFGISSTDGSLFFQDLRVLPEKSAAKTIYYDFLFRKPIAHVNSRNVATLTRLDHRAREVATYRELANGGFTKADTTEFVYNGCVLDASRPGKISRLVIGGIEVDLAENEYEYQLEAFPAYVTEVTVEVETDRTGALVRKGFLGANGNPQWENPSCCGIASGLSLPLTAENQTLFLDVQPFNTNIYRIDLLRTNTGWTFKGGVTGSSISTAAGVANGGNISDFIVGRSLFGQMLESGYSYSSSDEQWTPIRFTPGAQMGHSDVLATAQEHNEVVIARNRNIEVMRQLPEGENDNFFETRLSIFRIEKSVNPWIWLQVGSDVSQSSVFEASVAIHPVSHQPWVAYVARDVDEEDLPVTTPGVQHIYVKRWNGSQWVPVGRHAANYQAMANASGVVTGRVSEVSARKPVLRFSQSGVAFISYIAKYIIDSDENLPSGESQPSRMDLVHLKRLYEANASGLVGVAPQEFWAGLTIIKELDENEQVVELGMRAPLVDGDKLFVPSPLDFRFQMNGESPVIALLYQPSRIQNTSDGASTVSSEHMAIAVYSGLTRTTGIDQQLAQLLEWEPYTDNSVSNVLSSASIEEERSIIVYGTADIAFDLAIHQNAPWVAFRSEKDDGRLTVVRYNTNENRWLSHGLPAFMEVQEGKPVFLSVNANGNPHVGVTVGSENVLVSDIRSNKLSVMRHIPGSKDLTLFNISFQGDLPEVQARFRQYLQQYEATLETFRTSIPFSVQPRVSSDVLAIAVRSGDRLIGAWRNPQYGEQLIRNAGIRRIAHTSIERPFDVPLSTGSNRIRIQIIGTDNSTFSYYIDLLNPEIVPQLSSRGAHIVPAPGNPRVLLVYPNDREICPQEICLNIPRSWTLFFDRLNFSQSLCVPWDCQNSIPLIAVGPQGQDHPLTLIPGTEGVPYSGLVGIEMPGVLINPVFHPDTLHYSVIIPEVVQVNLALNINPGVLVEVNGIPLTGSTATVTLSPGVPVVINIINGDGSVKEYTITPQLPPWGEPNNPYAHLSSYALFTQGTLSLSDRVEVNGVQIGSNSNLALGVGSKMSGNVYGAGNLSLAGQSQVTGNVTIGGSVSLQAGASILGNQATNQTITPLSIPPLTISAGGVNHTINAQETRNIPPGSYGSLTGNGQSRVQLNSGTYSFTGINFNSGMVLELDCSAGPIILESTGAVNFGDNLQIINNCSNIPDNLILRTSGQTVNLGPDNTFRMRIVAPAAQVTIGSRIAYYGTIWANQIQVEPDTKIYP